MNITNLRLSNQQMLGTTFTTAREIVAWMGAMQAQDYFMAKWAVGVRLPGSTEQQVEDALNRGEIIRTHVLRPTWHLVAAEDLRWMLELSAAHIKAAIKSYNTGLGLTEAITAKSNALIGQVLQGGNYQTRAQLVTELQNSGIPTTENRAAQLLLLAELDEIICSGPIRDYHQTYTLLEEWIPPVKKLDRPAALAALAGRYFTSHGPATLQDFAWWSSLPAGQASQALEAVKPGLISETVNTQIYWFKDSSSLPRMDRQTLDLLPGFDEFIISYQDRSASLPLEVRSSVITSNGIFRPVILLDGRVLGVWSKMTQKDGLVLEAAMFTAPDAQLTAKIEKAAARFGSFVNKTVRLETSFTALPPGSG